MDMMKLLTGASILLAAIITVSHSFTIDEIAEKQAQVSRDMVTFFQEKMHEQEMILEERINLLEARISEIESRPVPAVPNEVRPGIPGEGSAGRREEQTTTPSGDSMMTKKAVDKEPPPAGEVPEEKTPEEKTTEATEGVETTKRHTTTPSIRIETKEAMKPTEPTEKGVTSRSVPTPSTAPDTPEPVETEKPGMPTTRRVTTKRPTTTSPTTIPPATTTMTTQPTTTQPTTKPTTTQTTTTQSATTTQPTTQLATTTQPTTTQPTTTQPTTKPTTTQTTTTPSATTTQATTTSVEEKYEVSCAAIYKNGVTTSREYRIDPDGSGDIAPFTVYCDMETTEGITMVGHSKEEENIDINGFDKPGSFVLEPVYDHNATLQQLGALADVSSACRQYAKYMCKASALMDIDTRSGLTYAWWVDRYGERRINFAGAPTDSKLCACGVTASCFMDSTTCNCDHRKAKNQSDEGFFDDKDLLPIKSLAFGDTGSKKERAAVTLGKLVCRG